MSYATADIADYMQKEIHRISSNPGGKKRGKVVRPERDYPYPAEENTNDKLAQAADVAPGVKRFRKVGR